MKKRKVPHTFVIVFCCIVVAAMMTWFIKPGKYVQEQVDGESVMTFYYQDQLPEPYAQEFHAEPQTWQVFSALFKGFEKQSGIIVFILIVGGAFWILSKSRAIDTGIMAFLGFTKRLEHNKVIGKIGVNNIIITMIMILFSLFGSVFGMSEETIAFTLIIIPLAISMGYDSIVGVCMVYVAAHIGFSGAMLNPFTIGIAQGIAGIPLFSGIGYRLVCWVILTIIGIIFVLLYAKKVKKNPKLSIVYEDDEYWRSQHVDCHVAPQSSAPRNNVSWWVYGIVTGILVYCAIRYPMTAMKIGNSTSTLPLLPIGAGLFALVGFFALRKSVPYFILTLLFGTVYYLIVGVLGYGWYIMEIATLFLFMGVCCGLSIGKSASDIAKLFIEGMGDILSAAVVVGLAAGIVIVLQDGGVIDTILYGLSKSMSNLGVIASTEIMYGIQTLINIVIPSGSAKAAITMPIMAPFSDLIGISRQTTVMAFQFGDGFTNMITPTSGVLIATLGVARIPWEKWVRFIWKFILVLIVVGGLLLIPTVTMSLNGF
ncbi:MAG: AbgT family transporter [Bacteroidales bacterium]|nr:AbgT family transporter [Bacteroidales bacterium]MBQ6100805.1 AbgT family transporter [Bacteroidales bacterium]